MKISDAIDILKTEQIFARTPSGRTITDYALKVIDASLADEKNYEMDCLKCLNCCIIVSGLLCANGCPNCGGHDLTVDINEE